MTLDQLLADGIFACPPSLLQWALGGLVGGFIGLVGGAWTMWWALKGGITLQRETHSQT